MNLPAAEARRRGIDPALLVILGGVCAALHVGKLPPAITALQASLGISLVQAGFLLSLVQLAGMSTGIAFGALADALGLERSMRLGLLVLSAASALGALADGAPALMLLRAAEGLGFLFVVLPAPGLVRRLVAPERLAVMLGLWGAYMPFAVASALLLGPLVIAAGGWRAWWLLLAAVSAAMAGLLWRRVPAVAAAPADAATGAAKAAATGAATASATGAAAAMAWRSRLGRTLAAPGPWLLAMAFGMYSSQWLAVVGFLPTMYAYAGVPAAAAGVLTALVAAANMAGNVASGRLLHRGISPTRLMAVGFVVMGVASLLAFAWPGLPAALRYGAVLAFSMVGGVIPGTLFALAVRVAPEAQLLSSTVGWMQQWSAFGQFAGPPAVAWLASRLGGWQWTWVATGACTLAGLALTQGIARSLRRRG